MPQAIVDPDHLIQFAGDIRNFRDRLRDETRRLKARLQQLGNTWRDQEYAKFRQELDKTVLALSKFEQVSDNYIKHLHNKARPLKEYLGRR